MCVRNYLPVRRMKEQDPLAHGAHWPCRPAHRPIANRFPEQRVSALGSPTAHVEKLRARNLSHWLVVAGLSKLSLCYPKLINPASRVWFLATLPSARRPPQCCLPQPSKTSGHTRPGGFTVLLRSRWAALQMSDNRLVSPTTQSGCKPLCQLLEQRPLGMHSRKTSLTAPAPIMPIVSLCRKALPHRRPTVSLPLFVSGLIGGANVPWGGHVGPEAAGENQWEGRVYGWDYVGLVDCCSAYCFLCPPVSGVARCLGVQIALLECGG